MYGQQIGFSVDANGKKTPIYETPSMVMGRFVASLCVVAMLAFSLVMFLGVFGGLK